ncbi:MAG TPA: aminotransferase class V-fold PLP-dependent enzyme [Nocardioidaceae bacterium]|nr:aminotransferase class V-fold PLP-dependent enzyme [Nocardioidaceae bacterium]
MSTQQPVSIGAAHRMFDPQPGWLNTASYGLPPRVAWEALQSALDDWRHGRTSWEAWAESTERARQSFARMIGADVADVSVGTAVSQQIGLIAASLPDGARVLAPEIEFGSNLFPYQMHASRGVKVETVPAADLLRRIDESIDVVAISAVQSATGEVTDLSEVSRRAHAAGALVVADATQAVGWLPMDVDQVDALACAAYKWLCSPRGTAFLYVDPELRDRIRPLAAGWYAGQDVHANYYGPQLDLARSARRFDLSPAWHCWVAAAPALELLEQVGIDRVREHNVRLANRFRTGLGLPESDSAIVSVSLPDADQRLAAAGIRAATRAGSLRASFHLYSTDADVDAAVAALTEPAQR